jgi:hypothetical protein
MKSSTGTRAGLPIRRLQRRLLHQKVALRAMSAGLVALMFAGCGPGQQAETSLVVPAISGVVSSTTTIDLLDLFPVRLIGVCRWLYTGGVSTAQVLLDAAGQAGTAATAELGKGDPVPATAPVGSSAAGSSASVEGSILTPAQSDRAATRLAGLSAADRTRLDAALAVAATPDERDYILKALAAGHSVDEVLGFAKTIHGRKPRWLRTHLNLLDFSTPGDLSYHGSPVDQVNNTTCGSAAILVARAMADPLYSLYLTTGNSTDPAEAGSARFQARLAAEEDSIHRASNQLWPQSLGTSPWGLASELNRYADATGTQYGWRPVVGTSSGQNSALRDAITAVDNGHPVPVLIGGLLPRHYVLMVGQVGTDVLFYDPGASAVVELSQQSFLKGDSGTLGFAHVDAVITPTH